MTDLEYANLSTEAERNIQLQNGQQSLVSGPMPDCDPFPMIQHWRAGNRSMGTQPRMSWQNQCHDGLPSMDRMIGLGGLSDYLGMLEQSPCVNGSMTQTRSNVNENPTKSKSFSSIGLPFQ